MLVDRYLARDGATLEAGTGGGRILLAMREMGFDSLTGFDVVPEMIRSAREADPSGAISFDVQDAKQISYPSDSFDQVIYLQQVLCFVEGAASRAEAVREAHRVLRPGGVALFSFLWWDSRRSRTFVKLLGPWLRILRAVRHSNLGVQDWPWVMRGRRPSIGALLDQGPYIHWFTTEEARTFLSAAGFAVEFAGGADDVAAMAHTANGSVASQPEGSTAVYFVCRKE